MQGEFYGKLRISMFEICFLKLCYRVKLKVTGFVLVIEHDCFTTNSSMIETSVDFTLLNNLVLVVKVPYCLGTRVCINLL